jgi:hypothetical protein
MGSNKGLSFIISKINRRNMKIPNGALTDDRIKERKDMDFLHEELAGGDEPFAWEEKPVRDRYYFPYDQSISLSCVAGGIAITEEHFSKGNFIPSRKDVYIRRMNYPGGGMALHDAFNIGRKGMCGESLVGSQGLSETPMNAQYPMTNEILKERSSHSFDAWVNIGGFANIDTLASVASHTPVVSFWFMDGSNTSAEWLAHQPRPISQSLGLYDSGAIHHQVCIVDAVLVGGQKFLVVQDTAGVGTGFGTDKNLRLMSQEMVSKRCYAAGYGIDQPEIMAPQKPKFKFTRPLSVGMSGDDVRVLQEVLKYEGCITLPVTTKLFGGITLAGVKKLQEKHKAEILTPAGLVLPTGYVGTRTLAYLNSHYN